MSDVKFRWSTSKVDLYLMCGEAFRRRYIENEHESRGIAAVLGTAVHRGAEINYIQKKESRVDLPIDEVLDATRDAVKNEAENGINKDPDDGRPDADIIAETQDVGVKLSRIYYNEVAKLTQPKRVEEKIVLTMKPGVELVSVLDVQDEGGIIMDTKTSAASKTQREADRSMQLTLQWATARALDHVAPPAVRLDVLVKTKTPKLQQLISGRTDKDVQVALNVINAAQAGVEAGVFLPAAAINSWKCDPKYCGFFETCKFANPNK